jgi:hypothetical protein
MSLRLKTAGTLMSLWRYDYASLIYARILANKSEQRTTIGQTTLNQYYPHLPSTRTVTNGTLERIAGLFQDWVVRVE